VSDDSVTRRNLPPVGRPRLHVFFVGGGVLKLAAGSSTQEVLPFTGLKYPNAVAVDSPSGGWLGIASAGNVYVADSDNNRVLKLPAGSNTQAQLPFTGLNRPGGVAVDTTGNVYIIDGGNKRVLKLPAA
jgi:serine/threonine-protein kinase